MPYSFSDLFGITIKTVTKFLARAELIHKNKYKLNQLNCKHDIQFHQFEGLDFELQNPCQLCSVNINNMANTKWSHTALLVIDMQNDFILDNSLFRVDGGKAIVPNVIKSVEKVVREHDPQGRDVELFRRHLYSTGKLGPSLKGSRGAELVDGLAIKEGDYKVVKTRFSAFFATHLHSFLQGAGIRSLVVAGVQTPNCIRQTVFDAVALDYQSVTVIVDATAAAKPDIHATNIFDMKNVGVATPTLQEWLEADA